MASAGSIALQLRLESAAFRQEMKRATSAVNTSTAKMRTSMKRVESATKNLNRQFGQLKAGVVALAGALAVRQFATFTKNALNSGAAIQDVADKVGVTTTQLQQLRFAATQSGVSVQTLDMALQRFSRRVGEVAQGQGELLKTAQQYNVTLRDSEGRMRSNIDILKDFAEVIRTAESDQERLRIAFKLFDSEGAALVNTLRDGRVALEAYMQQAIDFGAVMSSDVIAQAKLASDNLEAMGALFKTAFDTAIIKGFADSLTITKDNMLAAREAGQTFGEVVGVAMRGVVEAARFVARNMRELVTILGALIAMKAITFFFALGAAILKFGQAMLAAAKAGAVLNAVTGAGIVGLVKLGVTIAGGVAAWSLFEDQARAAAAAISDANASLRSSAAGVGATNKQFEEHKKRLIDARDAARELAKAHKKGEEAVQRVNAAVTILNIERQIGTKLTKEQRQELFDLIREEQRYRDEIEKTVEKQREAQRAQEAAIERNRKMMEEPISEAEPEVRQEHAEAFAAIFERKEQEPEAEEAVAA